MTANSTDSSCYICHNSKRPIKFKSKRMQICQWCISLLKDSVLDKNTLDAYIMKIASKHVPPPPSEPTPAITKEKAFQIAKEQVGQSETFSQYILKSIFASGKRDEQVMLTANRIYDEATRSYSVALNKYREELAQYNDTRQSKVLENYRDLLKGFFRKYEHVELYAKSRYLTGRPYLRTDYKNVLTENDKNMVRKLRAINLNIMAGTEKCPRLLVRVSNGIKKGILQDDDYKCGLCGKPTPEGETHLHHIIPIANYGSNHENNLIALCYTCHNKQHKHTVTRRKKRTRRVQIDVLPPVFVAIDIETTGLNVKSDRIVEIAAVKFLAGRHSENYTTLINPEISIPQVAKRVHGISDEMVCNAPRFEHIADELIAFIGDAPLVAHCGNRFDIKIIKNELGRFGKSINNATIDTLPLSRRAFPKLLNHQLPTLKNHLDMRIDVSHRAYEDALSAGYLYVHCLRKLGVDVNTASID